MSILELPHLKAAKREDLERLAAFLKVEVRPGMTNAKLARNVFAAMEAPSPYDKKRSRSGYYS